jgi:hypothetical protein
MTILERCKQVSLRADDAVKWADSAQSTLGARTPHVTRQAERARDVARLLERASTLPSAVGVFGPSQVGKSYLINALAKGKKETLKVALGDKSYDFLTDINPPGGGTEATGIVTRFSLNAHPERVDNHPIRVRLHSVADLVKIIANTYFSDFSAQELEKVDGPSPEDLERVSSVARSSSASGADTALTARDIDWIRAYLWGRFSHRKTVKFLEASDYWRDLETHAANLTVEACADVFKIIWGSHDVFTKVFLDLAKALESLSFADAAYCHESALVPRETSMLDASNLYDIGRPDCPKVSVTTTARAVAQVPLPSLSAIVAELQIQIEEQAHDFQSHTDVLDFPGARSRHNWHDVSATLKNPEKMGEAILRGKVAYLFERFTDDFMLNSLVFCARPGNQEVKTVSDYLTPWVLSVHGRKPSDREGQTVGLFVALTFFDERFKEAEGGDMSWHDSVRTALVDLLNDSSKWVENWTESEAFSNVFWIRNPSFKARGLMKYDSDGKEVEVLEPDRIAEFREDYLSTELVQRHIIDPGDRFDAPFVLGDGGVGYMAERLERVCTPDLKDRQIAVRLKANLKDLKAELNQFFIPIEGGEEAARARIDQARSTIRGLMGAFQSHKFGQLLNDLTVQHEEIVAALSRLDVSTPGVGESMTPPASTSKVEGFLEHILDPEPTQEGESAVVESVEPESHVSALAQRVIDFWTDKVLRLTSQSKASANYHVVPSVLSNMAEELISGLATDAFKLRLTQHLESVLLQTEKSSARKQRTASVASELIGSYVTYLGQVWLEADGQARNRAGSPVFSRSSGTVSLENSDLSDQDRAARVFSDWCTAYFALVERNASAGASASGNTPENKALGVLLSEIEYELNKL